MFQRILQSIKESGDISGQTIYNALMEKVGRGSRLCYRHTIRDNKKILKYTTSSFALGSHEVTHNRKCVYYLSDSHSPPQCERVSNVGSRTETLKKDSRCFLCFKKGHISKHCLSKYECRKWNRRHNISICSKSRNDFIKDGSKKNNLKNDDFNSNQSSSNHVIAQVDVLKSALLQTARAQICNIKMEETLTPRIMFNTVSQRTYITENLQKIVETENTEGWERFN